MIKIDKQISIATDTATLALYDLAHLNKYSEEDCDWWVDIISIPEVKEGKVAIISLEGDGVYNIRVTTEPLTEIEKAYAQEVIDQFGIEITSESFVVNAGENLPGGGELGDEGHKFKCTNGAYDLEIYTIDAAKAETDGYAVPADYVVILKKRTKTFKPLNDEPRFEWKQTYLYHSALRKKYHIELGLELPATVLVLELALGNGHKIFMITGEGKNWPKGYSEYSVQLSDTSKLTHGDEIIFKITSVNEDDKIINAELVKILSKKQGVVEKLISYFRKLFT